MGGKCGSLAAQTGRFGGGIVKASGHTNEVIVRGANHDAKVVGLVLAMGPFEMLAVVGQRNTRFLLRIGEDLVIGPTLASITATFGTYARRGRRIGWLA
jgi:hypothetical protein